MVQNMKRAKLDARAEQFADKPLFREAFARPRQCRKTRAFRRFGEDWGRTSEAESRPRDTATVREIQDR